LETRDAGEINFTNFTNLTLISPIMVKLFHRFDSIFISGDNE
ncbi:14453_t:CDS:1, partial [Dentiscutata heterogama]